MPETVHAERHHPLAAHEQDIDAKMAAGYFTPGPVPDADALKQVRGRGLEG